MDGHFMPNDAVQSTDEYANLDAQDESLARWHASLGIVHGATGQATGPKVTILELQIHSQSLAKPIIIDVQKAQNTKDSKPVVVIKQGIEYTISITFKVNHSVVSGLRYIQVAKRMAMSDKTERMIGSYGPQAEPYTKNFDSDKAPYGALYHGSYHVTSCVTDDEKEVYAEWRWNYNLAKDW